MNLTFITLIIFSLKFDQFFLIFLFFCNRPFKILNCYSLIWSLKDGIYGFCEIKKLQNLDIIAITKIVYNKILNQMTQ